MRVQILTNGETMVIDDLRYDAGELQFVYLVDVDKTFPGLNLGLENVSHEALCRVVRALVAEGDFYPFEDIQLLGYLELQRDEEID